MTTMFTMRALVSILALWLLVGALFLDQFWPKVTGNLNEDASALGTRAPAGSLVTPNHAPTP